MPKSASATTQRVDTSAVRAAARACALGAWRRALAPPVRESNRRTPARAVFGAVSWAALRRGVVSSSPVCVDAPLPPVRAPPRGLASPPPRRRRAAAATAAVRSCQYVRLVGGVLGKSLGIARRGRSQGAEKCVRNGEKLTARRSSQSPATLRESWLASVRTFLRGFTPSTSLLQSPNRSSMPLVRENPKICAAGLPRRRRRVCLASVSHHVRTVGFFREHGGGDCHTQPSAARPMMSAGGSGAPHGDLLERGTRTLASGCPDGRRAYCTYNNED